MLYDGDFNSEGNQIIFGTSSLLNVLYDIQKNKIIRAFKGHLNSVKNVQFCENNSNIFVSGGKDGKLLYFDI